MLPTLGLRTHIWNTGLRSVLLLAGFPVLLAMITWAVALLFAAADAESFAQGISNSIRLLPAAIPVALLISAIWFAIAWFANQKILDLISGARPVTRDQEPALWNMTEELAISRGMRMPRLAVIETPARNAFASGLQRDKGAVTVTRGLMQALGPRELRAVLAHELTHIRNGDARLGVVAAVFTGIISVTGEMIWRGLRFGRMGMRRLPRGGSSGGSGKGKGGAVLLVVLAVGIAALAWVLSIALRMALSRNREYLADAGAVEMTADPDAMASALQKLVSHSEMERLPGQVRALLLHDAASSKGPSWFATHPPIEQRVEALRKFAGARDLPPLPSPEAAVQPAAEPDPDATLSPWVTPPAAPSADAPHSPASSPPANPWWRQPSGPPGPG